MAATTSGRTRARNGSGAPAMPKLTVARLEEALLLVEQLVSEHTDVFVKAGQDYRERHRDGTSRPLNADEIARIALGLGVNLASADAQIQEAGLTHHDEPEPQEVLLAAGVATAPAFLRAAMRLTALLEMSPDTFEDAREAGTLREAVAELVNEYGPLDVPQMRARAAAALEHLSVNTGVAPGKAWEVVTRTVTQGLGQALAMLAASRPESSLSAPSTDSAAAMEGSPAAQSSTTSPGERPRD